VVTTKDGHNFDPPPYVMRRYPIVVAYDQFNGQDASQETRPTPPILFISMFKR